MIEKDFCPFINDTCRSECVFNASHYIGLNGYSTKCELAAFASCTDDETVELVTQKIRELQSNR